MTACDTDELFLHFNTLVSQNRFEEAAEVLDNFEQVRSWWTTAPMWNGAISAAVESKISTRRS